MNREINSAIDKPLVSIGMGVYNAEQFLSMAIQSILDQDYPNIELVIINNGSRDGSEKICREFMEKDSRITYRKNEKNINPLKNWCMLLDLCSGVYHAWAADHDLHHPKYISSLVEQFQCNDDSLIMAYPDARYIDINGKPIRDIREDVDTRGLTAAERFKKVMWGLTYCTPMYGLFKADALKKTYIERSITGPDRVFLAEYSLMGTFAHHKEPLFFMRQNRPPENYIQTKKRQMKWFVPNKYETFVPTIMRDYEHIKVVHASKLKTSEKESLVEDILRWHHAEPHKHSKREVLNLIQHGLEILSAQDQLDEDKLCAVEQILRIVEIGRLFRPALSPHIDELCELRTKLSLKNNPPLSNTKVTVETGSNWVKTNHDTGKGDNPPPVISDRNLSEKQPLVTIGLTVYNQSPYLQKTIDSILAQSYTNYELIIADNASDDHSAEICQYYANKDARIRLIRQKYNIGLVANMDLVLNAGTGKFFLLATGHDLYHPEYLSILVNAFMTNSDSVVMGYPQTVYIDEKNNVIDNVCDTMVDTRGMEAAERFKKTIWNVDLGNIFGGLFRTSALLRAWKPYTVRGPGYMLAAELSLIGAFLPVRAKLFYKRRHQHKNQDVSVKEKYAKHFSMTMNEAIIPYTMFAVEHIHTVLNSNLDEAAIVLLNKEIQKCFNERYGLQGEAILFLQKGVDLLKSDFNKVNNRGINLSELNQLTQICSVFNTAYKTGFDQFSRILSHRLAN